MTLRLSMKLANVAAPLEPAAGKVQDAVKALPRPVRDVLGGVWLGAPLHPALTDVPLGSWTAAAAFDAVDALTDDDSLAPAADAAAAATPRASCRSPPTAGRSSRRTSAG